MLVLAERHGQGPILISDIAAGDRMPRKFLELILLELKNHGLLQSKKGKGGGYFLGKPPGMITVGQVVRIIDGPIAPLPCVSRTAYMKCDECADERTCAIRLVMKDVREATAAILDSVSLSDMINRVHSVETGKEALNFAI
jgi:Rrf2 family protein